MVFVEDAMNEVRYPWLRARVISAVAHLGDREYQERVWINKKYPRPNYYDELDESVHTLYDDTDVLEDPKSMLGTVLLPGDEVERLRALDRVLGPLIDELGDVPDAEYLADPRWPAVLTAASAALTAMIVDGIGFWPAEDESGPSGPEP